MDLEQSIRERAYDLWQQQGCPQDREAEHWLQAEREIIGEGGAARKAQPEAGPGGGLRRGRMARIAAT